MMTNMLHSLTANYWLLLAGQERYVQMGRRFRRNRAGVEPMELLMVMAALVAVVVAAWLLTRYLEHRAKRVANCPKALFSELCRAHGLNHHNRQLLTALARVHRLPHPPQLFVEPERFEPERLGGQLADRRDQLNALKARLFAPSVVDRSAITTSSSRSEQRRS